MVIFTRDTTDLLLAVPAPARCPVSPSRAGTAASVETRGFCSRSSSVFGAMAAAPCSRLVVGCQPHTSLHPSSYALCLPRPLLSRLSLPPSLPLSSRLSSLSAPRPRWPRRPARTARSRTGSAFAPTTRSDTTPSDVTGAAPSSASKCHRFAAACFAARVLLNNYSVV